MYRIFRDDFRHVSISFLIELSENPTNASIIVTSRPSWSFIPEFKETFLFIPITNYLLDHPVS